MVASANRGGNRSRSGSCAGEQILDSPPVYCAIVRPNIMLVVLDTARADAFEPYGAGSGAGPTIAELARRGTAFPTAISASNWTMPSHASMFSGALPRTIGLDGAPQGRAELCRPSMEAQKNRLLPEVLRRAGYSTRAISCNTWISRHTGFDIGFDTFVEGHSRRQRALTATKMTRRLAWAVEAWQARVDDGAGDAERAIAGWLKEDLKPPFFWFVNLIECHSPFMPPRPYNDLSALQRLRVAEEARRHLTMSELWRACLGGYDIPNDTMARMRHMYGRSVRLMDDWLARVLERLDRAALLKDTLVIVTSDHGENLGEGHLIGHSFSLDQRLVHVPFVLAGPDPVPTPPLFSLASLPQLIARAIGLAEHPWVEEPTRNGYAFSQYKAVIGRDDPRAREAIENWGLDEDAIVRLTAPATSATDGAWKVVRNGEIVKGFDLRADPLERTPFSTENFDRVAELTRLRAAVDSVHTDSAPTVDDAVPEPPSSISDEEKADLEERLRELGYM